jgi:AcrR family transcriptional regulator
MDQLARHNASRGPRRTQAERREESDRGLIQGAIRVIASQGVAAATFESIGRESGYSRGLAAQRFGSKQGLIDAIIDYLDKSLSDELIEAGVYRKNGLEAVLAFIEVSFRRMSQEGEPRAYFMLLASSVADLSASSLSFAALHQRIKERLIGIIERGMKDGSIRKDIEVAATAVTIGSMTLGASMAALVDPDMQLDAVRTTTLASFRRSLQAKGA